MAIDWAAVVSAINPLNFLPVRTCIILSYEQGVRFVLGYDTALVKTGLRWRFGWGIGKIETQECTLEALQIKPQSCVTSDDEQVLVSTAIEYRIVDLRKLYRTVQEDSYELSLMTKTKGEVLKQVRLLPLEDLLDDQDALGEAVMERLQPKVEEWGIEIVDVYRTDSVKAKHFRLVGDQE